MTKAETIISAAVQRDAVIYSVPQPARHGDIMAMVNRGRADPILFKPEEQGFLTSEGRFVSRFRARQIAIRAGQIKEVKWPPELFSEDLW